jgi:hypothetical protein
MTGARKGWPEKGIVYPRSELALRHGAGVEVETTSPAEAYAPFSEVAALAAWKPELIALGLAGAPNRAEGRGVIRVTRNAGIFSPRWGRRRTAGRRSSQ